MITYKGFRIPDLIIVENEQGKRMINPEENLSINNDTYLGPNCPNIVLESTNGIRLETSVNLEDLTQTNVSVDVINERLLSDWRTFIDQFLESQEKI